MFSFKAKALSYYLIILLALSVAGCDPDSYYGRFVPTNWFDNALDINGDGEASRLEWEIKKPVTNIFGPDVRIFEQADCNHNGRLTWLEYYESVIQFEECATTDNESLYSLIDSESDSRNLMLPLILHGHQIRSISAPLGPKSNAARQSLIRLAPANIYEETVPPSGTDQIGFTCDVPQEPKSFPPFVGLIRQDTLYPSMECIITNNLQDTALSLLMFKTEGAVGDRTQTTWQAKAVYLPPHTSERQLFIFPSNSTPISVEIYNARGMSIDSDVR